PPGPNVIPPAPFPAVPPNHPSQVPIPPNPVWIQPKEPRATTAMVLGIIAIAGGMLCYLPALCGPAALVIGLNGQGGEGPWCSTKSPRSTPGVTLCSKPSALCERQSSNDPSTVCQVLHLPGLALRHPDRRSAYPPRIVDVAANQRPRGHLDSLSRSPSLSRGRSKECSRRRTVASTPTGRRPTPCRRQPTVTSRAGGRRRGRPVPTPPGAFRAGR